MKAPHRNHRARLARAFLVGALALLAAAPSASAYVTEQQAQDAADAAVTWFATQQDAPTGELAGFGGDWAMVALAGADVNAADFKAGSADPSVQDFLHQTWDWFGPGDLATDQERAILAGEAGGIQTAKLSSSRNLVAKLATFFDGTQLGSTALVNDDIFGLLALDHAGPADAISPSLAAVVRASQTTKTAGEPGWNFSGQPSQDPDVDMTGAGIAALCAAGADASDPAVAKAIDWLETKQDDSNGGIVSSFFGANADSTAWVVNGLRQCGVDPQGPEWTTSTGKTPLDFLLTLQLPSGAMGWTPGDTFENLYSTQDAVTALVGDGFGATPPQREDPSEPAVRPAPPVADGTPVPLTLVLDHGSDQPGAERACSVTAPVGATVAAVLQAAAVNTTPAYCLTELKLTGGGADARVVGINGVAAAAGAKWEASVDGGVATQQLTDVVGLGSTVVVKLDGAAAGGEPDLPPLKTATPARSRPKAKAVLARGQRLKVGRRGGLKLTVRCPRGLGAIGCQGVLRVKYRTAKGRYVTAGSRTFVVRPGKRRAVKLQLGPRLRKLAARPGGRRVRIEAIVRDPSSGAIATTRVQALIRR